MSDATADESRYMGAVAELPCVLCRRLLVNTPGPSEVHHIREGVAGAGQRAPHALTMPLCRSCHRGPLGVHGDKSLLRIAKVTEHDLLADAILLAFIKRRGNG